MKKMKVLNKFYCGTDDLEGYAVSSLPAALKQAQKKLDENPERESVNIVQIIKVVKRERQPLLIFDVE